MTNDDYVGAHWTAHLPGRKPPRTMTIRLRWYFIAFGASIVLSKLFPWGFA